MSDDSNYKFHTQKGHSWGAHGSAFPNAVIPHCHFVTLARVSILRLGVRALPKHTECRDSNSQVLSRITLCCSVTEDKKANDWEPTGTINSPFSHRVPELPERDAILWNIWNVKPTCELKAPANLLLKSIKSTRKYSTEFSPMSPTQPYFPVLLEQMADLQLSPRRRCGLIFTGCRWEKTASLRC